MPSRSVRHSSRPNLREEQKRFTRQRLLEAAAETFGTRGYEAATIEEIARAAGASRATFYLHFKSKLDLVQALAEEIKPDLPEIYSTLDATIAEGSYEDFRAWVKRALDWYVEHDTVVSTLEHVLNSRSDVAQYLSFTLTDMMPRLRASIPESRKTEMELRIWLLVNLAWRVHLLWRVEGLMSEVDEDLMVDMLTELWARGLGIEPRVQRPRKGRGGARTSR